MSEKERLKPGAAMRPWGELAYMACWGGDAAGNDEESDGRATCILPAAVLEMTWATAVGGWCQTERIWAGAGGGSGRSAAGVVDVFEGRAHSSCRCEGRCAV